MLTALSALGVNHELSAPTKHARSWARRRFPPQTIRVHYFGKCGTAIRPLTAALSLTQSEFIIDGDEAMRERPIGPLVDALKALGIGIQYTGKQGFLRSNCKVEHSAIPPQHSTVAYPANISRHF